MANRSNRFLLGLLTGYGSIAANVVFTMVSIPLALKYLSKEEFGLWALALQVNGYLALLELGMSGATFRFVADYKDNVNGGEYGSLLITGGLVFAIQGTLIALLGICLSWLAPFLFAVPDHLAGSFSGVLSVLAGITGVGIALRSLAAPLWAFQRAEVINGCGTASLFARLGLMWVGFELGWGIHSLSISFIPPTLGTLWIHYWICRRNHYYPTRGNWGRPRWGVFKEVFAYGRDGLLLSVGSQLVNASQITIISRVLGLDAAATFSVATKLFGMAQQVFHKIVESAAPGFTELYIRGEIPRFVQRYWEVTAITLAAATIGGVAIAAGNSAFIAVWTAGTIGWSPGGDAMLGLLIILTSLSRCFIALFGITKDLRSVRVLYFIEGLVFVPLAIAAAKYYGLEGILAASLVAHLAVALVFSARAASKVLGSCKPLQPGVLLSLAMIALAAVTAWAGREWSMPMAGRLALAAVPLTTCCVLVWSMTIPDSIRLQIAARLTAATRRFRKSSGNC